MGQLLMHSFLQLLLDLQGLKHCLMHLVLAPGDSAPIPTSLVFLVLAFLFLS